MTKLPKKTPYLVTKGGRHYFRIAIPKELIPVFGKTEHSEALGDINKFQAEVLAAQLGAEWQAKFLRERHRMGLAPQPPVSPKTATPDTRPGVELTDLPGFFGPIISRKMAPHPRGAHEKESIH